MTFVEQVARDQQRRHVENYGGKWVDTMPTMLTRSWVWFVRDVLSATEVDGINAQARFMADFDAENERTAERAVVAVLARATDDVTLLVEIDIEATAESISISWPFGDASPADSAAAEHVLAVALDSIADAAAAAAESFA
ncbi:MAG: hypothetical protein WDM94_07240 [Bauldia sp.]